MNNIQLPPIYVINLKKSTERLENIKKVMEKYNLNFERFDAIYGKELSQEEINKNTNILCRTLLCNNGMIGCAMSHIQIWKKLLEDNTTNSYIIMEDDIQDINIKELNDLIKFINDNNFDYDFISLTCVGILCIDLKKGIKINDTLYLTKKIYPLGMGCYIINKQGAKKIIDMINKYKITYHIDFSVTTKNFLSNNNFKYYNTNYSLIDINLNNIISSQSTISANKNKSIILTLLNKSNLHTLEWYFKVPYFTLFRKVEINLYFLLLIILLILNIKKFKIKYLNYFIILEMLLLSI